MAFDELLVDRIRVAFDDLGATFEEKKMMGGMCFMVDDKMCCGTFIDKKTDENSLMLRVGQEVANEVLESDKHAEHMEFTGRRMKDFLTILPPGMATEKDLKRWIQLCLDFNPIAKSSKKKKRNP